MAFEIIKSIVEAEQEAESIKAQAFEEAEGIKAHAANTSVEIALNTKKQAKLDEEALIRQAVDGSKEKVAEIINQAKEKCNTIKETAENRKEKAISAVVGKVVGKYGHS